VAFALPPSDRIGRPAGYLARLGLGRLWRPRSEWWIAALSLAGWAGLVAAQGDGGVAGLCSGGGWIGRLAGEWRAGVLAARLIGCAAMTAAMVAAMTPPLSIDSLRLVALRSLPRWKARTQAAWFAGYAGVWAAATMLAALLIMALPSPMRPNLSAAAFLAAALWQLTPAKRRALNACHKAQPLPVGGPKAVAAGLSWGARVGLACLAACGPMMLAAMTAPLPAAAMAGVFVVALYERYVARPPFTATALALAAAGGLIAVAG
jgi:hypothetical protein